MNAPSRKWQGTKQPETWLKWQEDQEMYHSGAVYTMTELTGINILKNGKAAGVDDIHKEQIKYF